MPSFDFGLALRRANINTALTHPEIAARAGITRSHISHCVKGRNSPSIEVIGRVADIWGLSYAEFFEGGEPPKEG